MASIKLPTKQKIGEKGAAALAKLDLAIKQPKIEREARVGMAKKQVAFEGGAEAEVRVTGIAEKMMKSAIKAQRARAVLAAKRVQAEVVVDQERALVGLELLLEVVLSLRIRRHWKEVSQQQILRATVPRKLLRLVKVQTGKLARRKRRTLLLHPFLSSLKVWIRLNLGKKFRKVAVLPGVILAPRHQKIQRRIFLMAIKRSSQNSRGNGG